ncbi:MAG: hypothetical protein WD749_14460 [Phycisphaerales bacterium]
MQTGIRAPEPPAATGADSLPRAGAGLPQVTTELVPADLLDRLETLARRGRLPGFQRGGRGLFSVEAHGHPFDAELIASAHPTPPGTELTFDLRLRRRLPALFAIVLLATIWPGVYFMDQLIPGEWGWPATWIWYLPLTILPLPFLWRSLMAKSRRSNHQAAQEAIRKIAAELARPVHP